jgi:hypothetical protein
VAEITLHSENNVQPHRHGGVVLFWKTFVAFPLDPPRICGLLWVNTGELIQFVLSGQLADMVRCAATFKTKPLLQSRVPSEFVAFHRSVEQLGAIFYPVAEQSLSARPENCLFFFQRGQPSLGGQKPLD